MKIVNRKICKGYYEKIVMISDNFNGNYEIFVGHKVRKTDIHTYNKNEILTDITGYKELKF